MLKYKDKEMAIPKVLRNNITKYLGIVPDLRRKDFKQLVAENGGLDRTIISLKSRLNEVPAYKKTLKVKGYYEAKKIHRFIGNITVNYFVWKQKDYLEKKQEKTTDIDSISEEDEYVKPGIFDGRICKIYRRVCHIRFDKVIAKKEIKSDVKNIVDDVRKSIFYTDSYIIHVSVENYSENIYEYENDKKLENVKMKDAGVCMIDGYDTQKWDTGKGTCVFDYIYHHYKDIKGFKTVCCDYEKLNEVFKIDANDDCLSKGCSTINIKMFCIKFNLPMYALDDNEECFHIYQPANRNKKASPLMFRVSNKHFYPIPESKRKSVAKITSILNGSSDVISVHNDEDKKEAKAKNYVVLDNSNPMLELSKFIKETKTIPSNLKMTNTKLTSFNYKDDKYCFNQNIKLTEELCKNMGVDYQGQSLGLIIKEIVGDFKKSSHNPNVYETLKKAKKSRAFAGLITNYEKEKCLQEISTITNDINKIDNQQNKLKQIEKKLKLPEQQELKELQQKQKKLKELKLTKQQQLKELKLKLKECETKGTNLLETECFARDITKCYTSVMYNPLEDWILLDFNDSFTDYHNEPIETGLYYVETDDTTLFKKSDVYSSAIVLKAIEEDIKFKITKKLIPKNTEQRLVFKPIIDKIVEVSKGNNDIYKLMINMVSGMLGKCRNTFTYAKINKCMEQIFDAIAKFDELGMKVFIEKIPDTDYYLYGYDNDVELNESNLPMYLQVLDQANIKLYDMIIKYEKMGYKLLGRKIDCGIFQGTIDEKLEGNEWGSIRESPVPILDYLEDFKEKVYDFNTRWNDYKFIDSDDWEKIMNVMVSKGGLLLQGNAGNGKSYVAKQISQNLTNVKKIAPTNMAALNIRGSTIHKFLKMNKDGLISSKTLDMIKRKFKYIIVDEISMISKEMWRRLCVLKQSTNITFLLVGDNKQLPPVEDEEIDNYFNHSAVRYLSNNNRNILRIKKRYDEKLAELLEDVDEINIDEFDKDENQVNICFLNTTRKAVNKLWNDRLKKKDSLFIPFNSEDEYTQDMYIYENLPVIARRTVEGGEIMINNETYSVINYDDTHIYLYCERPDDDGEKVNHSIDVEINKFNDLFALNYCSTTHKKQGATITENFTIYDWNKMSTRCRYTALSRARKPEQVSFASIKTEEHHNDFDDNIKSKIRGYASYDVNTNISIDKVKKLYERQNGECVVCNCTMKTTNYRRGDDKQFSIDRIDSRLYHTDDNIQLLCWGCNRSKKDRF